MKTWSNVKVKMGALLKRKQNSTTRTKRDANRRGGKAVPGFQLGSVMCVKDALRQRYGMRI